MLVGSRHRDVVIGLEYLGEILPEPNNPQQVRESFRVASRADDVLDLAASDARTWVAA
jgi:hypothetical protein